MKIVISGFVELNSELIKISSVEDVTRLGSSFTELSVQILIKYARIND